MRTLHSYLTRQILASLGLTLAIFTFVLLVVNVLREIIPFLKSGQMNLFAELVGLLIPFVWVFALPMGLLTATLLIFGRFSADQELTAVRASGISLLSIITPILLLSLALCAVSAMFNMYIGPLCRVKYNSLLFRLKGSIIEGFQVPEGQYVRDTNSHAMFYVSKNRGGNLEDVMVYYNDPSSNGSPSEVTVHAPRGVLERDAAHGRYIVHLFDCKSMRSSDGKTTVGPSGSVDLEFNPFQTKPVSEKVKISDMTFLQLREELRAVEAQMGTNRLQHITNSTQIAEVRKQFAKQKVDLVSPILVHMHQQVAFSFACFGFALVGIPLGIQVHRRETNIGFGIAILLVAVYYSFILTGQALETRPEFAPHLIVWFPNFLFQAIGAVLLWRANKGI